MTLHNEANKEDIAKIVLMPGDPLRAKYIAENFLEDARLVNKVRNMYAYTGKYKGKEITVMAHGMGMSSASIYVYELYRFYDVDTIIRIGSCGALGEGINLTDTILVDKSYTEANFAKAMNNEECYVIDADRELNDTIERIAKENGVRYIKGDVSCKEVFDAYLDDKVSEKDKELGVIGAEMESFALFYIAKMFNKKAACLLTVVDSKTDKRSLSPEERENGLNDMIKVALETTLELN